MITKKGMNFGNSFLYKNRERIIPGAVSQKVFSDHYARYLFSTEHCRKKKILNVASGSGYGSEVLLGVAKEIYNVDIDDSLISYGNRFYGNYRNHFLKMNAQKMEFPDCFFDIIVSFETFEHLPEPEKFIKECHRVLKKGGVLILSTPNKTVSSPYSKSPVNKFHHKEWYFKDLEKFLSKRFTVLGLYGQDFCTPRKEELKLLMKLSTKINNFVYSITPGFIFMILKRYILDYAKYTYKRKLFISEQSKVKKVIQSDFNLNKDGKSYLVMIFHLEKI